MQWFHLPWWRFEITFHRCFLPALFDATLKHQIKKEQNNMCFFFTDPRRTRGLSSATTYYWYKASGWSHLLVARMDGGSGASRVFLKAQTHHCSMDFTVFKFFVFGIPFASMLSWCFMALNPVSLIESRHGCSIVMLNIIWSYRQ